jgi:hypothetical protein
MPRDLPPQERAENAAHQVASSFLGSSIGEAYLLRERCAEINLTLGDADLINCVLEPVFLARLVFAAKARSVFASSANTFIEVVDQVFPGLFATIFGKQNADPLYVLPKLAGSYLEFSALREQQYARVRRSVVLKFYRLFKGDSWFDTLFLATTLRRDFADTACIVPAALWRLLPRNPSD